MNKKITIPVAIAIIFAAVLVAFPSTVFSPEYNQVQDQPQATNPQQPAEPEFDKNKYSITNPSSSWIIASKVHPLRPIDYAPDDLVDVGNGQQLRKEAAQSFGAMLDDAQAAGHEIVPLSGYRSYQSQQAVYASEVQAYGQNIADTQSARPGHSEHQTGLGIDVGGGGCGIEDCFGDTIEYRWLAEHAHKYGFIQRYSEGKQEITGYRAEPWHWRYVGTELATEMYEQKIETLEEFFNVIPDSQPW